MDRQLTRLSSQVANAVNYIKVNSTQECQDPLHKAILEI